MIQFNRLLNLKIHVTWFRNQDFISLLANKSLVCSSPPRTEMITLKFINNSLVTIYRKIYGNSQESFRRNLSKNINRYWRYSREFPGKDSPLKIPWMNTVQWQGQEMLLKPGYQCWMPQTIYKVNDVFGVINQFSLFRVI